MYDVIVIGGGPAGLAASIYLARQKMHFLFLAGDVGGKTAWSSDVENYLGFHLLDGVELVKKFREHLEDYRDSIELHEGERVRHVDQSVHGGFVVQTDKASYDTRTLLIATGEENRKLNIPGEKEFYGKGVTYCAACDAPLFADKRVHVTGGGNSAMDAALFLAKYAEHITLVSLNSELGGDAIMKRNCLAHPKISVLSSTKTTKITGENFVTHIGLQTGEGEERLEATEGVFIEIGLVPQSDFIDLVAKDQWQQIVIDKHNRTSVPGIWAAGDVTDVTEKQISVAVGEGSKAALEIIRYFQTTKNSI